MTVYESDDQGLRVIGYNQGVFFFSPDRTLRAEIYLKPDNTLNLGGIFGGGGGSTGSTSPHSLGDTVVHVGTIGDNQAPQFLMRNGTRTLTAPWTIGQAITLPNTGLHLLDTDASHDLILAPGSDLTADRTLTIATGDADRTLTLANSGTAVVGTGTATRIAQWSDTNTIAASTLIKSGAGVLTLSAGGAYTLTVPATGTAALATGISGGQTIYGGTGANDDITIHGTSNATRTTSYVILQPTAGNVGIGTTTPGSVLHVYRAGLFNEEPTLKLQGDANGSATLQVDRGGTARMSGVKFATGGTDDWFAGTYYNGGAAQSNFGVGFNYDVANQKFVIQATSGNIGVGTLGPLARLHVDYAGALLPALLVEQSGVHNNTLVVDAANGRVGAGVVPLSTLHVSGGQARLPNGSVVAGNSPGVTFDSYADTGFAANGDNLAFWESGTVVLNITAHASYKEFRVPSDFKYAFSSATNNNAASDTSFYRSAAGVLKTTGVFVIDQASTTGALPVLTLDQGDVSEEFIRLIGTSAADASQSLVDAADMTTPGAIVGWIKVYIQDDASSGAITDGVYYVPFYAAPTA